MKYTNCQQDSRNKLYFKSMQKVLPLLALLSQESTMQKMYAQNAAGSLWSLPAWFENLNNRGSIGHIVNAQKYKLITKTHLLITKTHLK